MKKIENSFGFSKRCCLPFLRGIYPTVSNFVMRCFWGKQKGAVDNSAAALYNMFKNAN
jgi:hypothetical protein